MPLESMNSSSLKSTTSARAEVGTASPIASPVEGAPARSSSPVTRAITLPALFDLELDQIHQDSPPFPFEPRRVRSIRTVVPSGLGSTSTVSIRARIKMALCRGRLPEAIAMRQSRTST